ncbi:MAG TPA: hypothetical protein VMZ52_12025 [Bryobacteraceae bacterium]|nr:hypothetical protein [Bryobacteraceae bacterium]
MAVHLVNLTNPMTMRGSYREVIPLGPQSVSLRLPDRFRPRAAKLLVDGRQLHVNIRSGRLEVEVPGVGLHEVIAVDEEVG